MNWKKLLQKAQQRHHYKIKIRKKTESKWFWMALSILLKIVTLGRGPDLLNGGFTTVIGRTIWTPGDWDSSPDFAKFVVLSHEIDHMDMAYFGDHTLQDVTEMRPQEKGWWFCFIHSLKYLFWPFPIFWATYRQQIEYWGFQRNLEVHLATHHGLVDPSFKVWMKGYFCGSAYAWMATEHKANKLLDDMVKESLARFRAGALDHLR